MTMVKGLTTACAIVLFGVAAGCGSKEPTAEEQAAIAAMQEQQREERLQRELVEFLTGYPETASGSIRRLEAMSLGAVRTIEGAADALQTFTDIARQVRRVERAIEGDKAPVSAEASQANATLKRRLIAKQRQLFPQMRRTYAAHMSNAVAGLQANFRAIGAGNKTLRGASPYFASSEVMMQAHHTMMVEATRFRFTRAEYVHAANGSYRWMALNGGADDDVGP